jgi:osmotically-inducible protein OsmY
VARLIEPDLICDLQVVPATSELKPADVDDESLQALVLFRLRLARETEHLPLKVKASRGVLTLQGKVRSEALRQRVEHIARATVGLHELRSTLTLSP